jgi:hypothetical protein
MKGFDGKPMKGFDGILAHQSQMECLKTHQRRFAAQPIKRTVNCPFDGSLKNNGNMNPWRPSKIDV